MDFPDNPDMRVSHETIYAYIYAMPKSQLRQVLIANLRRKHPERQNPSRTLSDRGRIADMVSKGSDLSHRTQEELDEISHLLNTRPRKSLGYLTPKEVYMSDFKLYHPDYNRCCT